MVRGVGLGVLGRISMMRRGPFWLNIGVDRLDFSAMTIRQNITFALLRVFLVVIVVGCK
jgi:hypothetical protein